MKDILVLQDSSRNNTRARTVVAAALFALAAAILVAWTTSRFGIGVSPDSAHYIGAARSLAAGRGLQFNGEPFTHWPPLYPILLAAISRFGFDALQSARALAATLFAVNVVLIVCLANRQTGVSPISGLIAGLVFLLTPELIHAHTMAWSEPLFYALSLLSVLFLLRWSRGRTRWLLFGAGALVGLAMLTRFVGATLLPPFLACILSASRRTSSHRQEDTSWADMTLFLAAAAIPITPWLIWSASVSHSSSDRAIQLHMPHTVQFAALAVITVAMVYGLLRQTAKHKNGEIDLFARWALAFGITYCGFLLASITFIDALTPLDGRILSPLIVFGISLVFRSKPIQTAHTGSTDPAPELSDLRTRPHPYISAKSADTALPVGANSQSARSNPALHMLAAGVVILVTALRLGISASVVRDHSWFGSGYTGASWRDSPTLHWVERIPQDVPIYSNAPDAIAFYGRAARSLPEAFSPTTLVANSHLDSQIADLNGALRQSAIIVYFHRSSRKYIISTVVLQRRCAVRLIHALPDGAIYGTAPE